MDKFTAALERTLALIMESLSTEEAILPMVVVLGSSRICIKRRYKGQDHPTHQCLRLM